MDVLPPNHYLLIYGNSDVIATLVITYFHLFLIKRDLRQRFQISVYDDVLYAQTWEVLTPKKATEPPYKGLYKNVLKDAPYGSIQF